MRDYGSSRAGAAQPDAAPSAGPGDCRGRGRNVHEHTQPSGTYTTMVWVWFLVTALILALVGAVAVYIALP
jgi:hypothetical protein